MGHLESSSEILISEDVNSLKMNFSKVYSIALWYLKTNKSFLYVKCFEFCKHEKVDLLSVDYIDYYLQNSKPAVKLKEVDRTGV